MPPSFTSAPQWLETPEVAPLIQPIFAGIPGPYEYGGKLFWVTLEVYSETGGFFQNLVAYRSDTLGTTQPSARIGSSIAVSASGTASVSYPGTGTLIYVSYMDTSIDNTHGTLQTVTFDMSTQTFGTPNSTGITLGSPTFLQINWLYALANGNLQLVYSYGSGSGTSFTYTAVYSSGSWSSPALVGTSVTTLTALLAAVPISSNNVGVYWANATTVFYSVLSGTTVSSTTTVATWVGHNSDVEPFSIIYDLVSDTAVLALVENVVNLILYLASPSSSPTCSIVTVATDPPDNYDWTAPLIIGNAAGNQFYIIVWDSDDNILMLFAATSLAGPWTGPTTFYSQSANPPVSPSPSGPEIFPSYATYISGGATLAVTSGFLANGTFGPICGMLAVMVVPIGPPPPPPSSGPAIAVAAPLFPAYTHRRGSQGGH